MTERITPPTDEPELSHEERMRRFQEELDQSPLLKREDVESLDDFSTDEGAEVEGEEEKMRSRELTSAGRWIRYYGEGENQKIYLEDYPKKGDGPRTMQLVRLVKGYKIHNHHLARRYKDKPQLHGVWYWDDVGEDFVRALPEGATEAAPREPDAPPGAGDSDLEQRPGESLEDWQRRLEARLAAERSGGEGATTSVVDIGRAKVTQSPATGEYLKIRRRGAEIDIRPGGRGYRNTINGESGWMIFSADRKSYEFVPDPARPAAIDAPTRPATPDAADPAHVAAVAGVADVARRRAALGRAAVDAGVTPGVRQRSWLNPLRWMSALGRGLRSIFTVERSVSGEAVRPAARAVEPAPAAFEARDMNEARRLADIAERGYRHKELDSAQAYIALQERRGVVFSEAQRFGMIEGLAKIERNHYKLPKWARLTLGVGLVGSTMAASGVLVPMMLGTGLLAIAAKAGIASAAVLGNLKLQHKPTTKWPALRAATVALLTGGLVYGAEDIISGVKNYTGWTGFGGVKPADVASSPSQPLRDGTALKDLWEPEFPSTDGSKAGSLPPAISAKGDELTVAIPAENSPVDVGKEGTTGVSAEDRLEKGGVERGESDDSQDSDEDNDEEDDQDDEGDDETDDNVPPGKPTPEPPVERRPRAAPQFQYEEVTGAEPKFGTPEWWRWMQTNRGG